MKLSKNKYEDRHTWCTAIPRSWRIQTARESFHQ